MSLSTFDIYLLAINIFGFLIFIPYIYLYAPNVGDESGWFDNIITLVSLLFGSLGILISICIFGRTNTSKERKETMMSRIFVWCILFIQIVIVLVLKGYIKSNLTINVLSYFSNHFYMVIYLLMINIITFAAFGVDKRKAIRRKNRIRISVLLFLSFVGGSIGALLAMYIFRHKTNLDYFTVGVPLTIVMQIFVLMYIMNMSIG